MTARKNTVLRTVFADTFVYGKLEITQSGTEVPTSEVEEIQRVARTAGVTLHEVEPNAAEAASADQKRENV